MALADEPLYLPANVRIGGSLQVVGPFTRLFARSEFAQENLQVFELPTADWKSDAAYQTPIGTPGGTVLGVTTGTYGTGLPYISTGDLKAAGATTRRMRLLYTLPSEYVAGQTVQLRLASGMVTTIADTSATVDAECFVSARNTLKTGSDLVSTAAQSINSVTFAELVFEITAGSLVPGNVLDLRVSIAVNDAATVTAVIGAIAHAEMQLDIKG